MEPAHNTTGRYSTDLFTSAAEVIIQYHNTEKPLFLLLSHLAVHSGNKDQPLQAPKEVIDKFSYIKDEQRRIYAGKVGRSMVNSKKVKFPAMILSQNIICFILLYL